MKLPRKGPTALAVLSGSFASAGGIKGSMFNLPDRNGVVSPIEDKEVIEIAARDLDGNLLELLDDKGNRFPPEKLQNGRLFVTGPNFSFTLRPINNGRRSQVINIDFFRSDIVRPGLVQGAAQRTETLPSVVISNDPAEMLSINVSVRRPSQMETRKEERVQCCPTVPWCDCSTTCWGRRRLFRR